MINLQYLPVLSEYIISILSARLVLCGKHVSLLRQERDILVLGKLCSTASQVVDDRNCDGGVNKGIAAS